MMLASSTWPEVEAYLERSRGVVIPLGSTEQHGPSGLIGTDAICAETVARGVGDATGALVGPTLGLGPAQFNLGFPGTVCLRPSTHIAVVEDYVLSLASQGFEHFYFLNGHGGNVAPTRAAIQEIHAGTRMRGESRSIRCRLRAWWDHPETDRLRAGLFGAGEGMHATPSEIAIAGVAHPEAVKPPPAAPAAPIDPDFVRDHPDDAHHDAAEHRRRFPDGRIGSDPGLATAEAGRRLLASAVAEASDDYRRFLAEEQP